MNDNVILKCSNCQNNIKVNRVKFYMDNDFGGMIVECEKCKESSFLKITNPMESHIVSGGRKIGYWDNEIQSDSDVFPVTVVRERNTWQTKATSDGKISSIAINQGIIGDPYFFSIIPKLKVVIPPNCRA